MDRKWGKRERMTRSKGPRGGIEPMATRAPPEASFRAQSMPLVSVANQLVVMSPVAKKCSVEQPIGTCAI